MQAGRLNIAIHLNAASFTSSVGGASAAYARAAGSMRAQTQQLNVSLGQLAAGHHKAQSQFAKGLHFGAGVASVLGVGAAIDFTTHKFGEMIARAGEMRDAVIAVMKPLGKQIYNGGRDLEYFNKTFRELVSITRELPGTRVDKLAEIALIGAKMGVADTEIVQFTRGVAAASIAISDMPVGEMAEQVARLMGFYNIGADQAVYFASAIDKLADSAKTSAHGLLQVTERAGAAASTLRLLPKDFMAIATALKDAGMMSFAAGSALQRFFFKFLKPDGVEHFAHALHMTNEEFIAMRDQDPGKVVMKVIEAIRDQGSNKVNFISDLGFKNAIDQKALVLLSLQVDKIKDWSAKAQKELETAAYVQNSIKLNLQKYAVQKEALSAAFDELAILIGGRLSAALQVANQHLTLLIRDFVDAGDDSEGFKAALDRLKDAVDVFFEALRDPSAGFDLFLKGLEVALAEAHVLFIKFKEAAIAEIKDLADRTEVTWDPVRGLTIKVRDKDQPKEQGQGRIPGNALTDAMFPGAGLGRRGGNAVLDWALGPQQPSADHAASGVGGRTSAPKSDELKASEAAASKSKAELTELWTKLRDRGRERRSKLEEPDIASQLPASMGGAIPGAPPTKIDQQAQQMVMEAAKAKLNEAIATISAATGSEKELEAAVKAFAKKLDDIGESFEGDEFEEVAEKLKETAEAAEEAAQRIVDRNQAFNKLLQKRADEREGYVRDKAQDSLFKSLESRIAVRRVGVMESGSVDDAVREGINERLNMGADLQKQQLEALREIVRINYRQADEMRDFRREFADVGG